MEQIIAGGIYGFAEGNCMSHSKTSINTASQWSGGTSYSSFSSNPSLNTYQLLVGIGYNF